MYNMQIYVVSCAMLHISLFFWGGWCHFTIRYMLCRLPKFVIISCPWCHSWNGHVAANPKPFAYPM